LRKRPPFQTPGGAPVQFGFDFEDWDTDRDLQRQMEKLPNNTVHVVNWRVLIPGDQIQSKKSDIINPGPLAGTFLFGHSDRSSGDAYIDIWWPFEGKGLISDFGNSQHDPHLRSWLRACIGVTSLVSWPNRNVHQSRVGPIITLEPSAYQSRGNTREMLKVNCLLDKPIAHNHKFIA
jgi:hypothetical protein